VAARQLLEPAARGGIVAVVELTLAQEEKRPVVVAQPLADGAAQRLRGFVVVARAVGGEAAPEGGARRGGGGMRCEQDHGQADDHPQTLTATARRRTR
jgi:hypothetical protein